MYTTTLARGRRWGLCHFPGSGGIYGGEGVSRASVVVFPPTFSFAGDFVISSDFVISQRLCHPQRLCHSQRPWLSHPCGTLRPLKNPAGIRPRPRPRSGPRNCFIGFFASQTPQFSSMGGSLGRGNVPSFQRVPYLGKQMRVRYKEPAEAIPRPGIRLDSGPGFRPELQKW